MGHYTTCILEFKTKPDTPENVIEFLKHAVNREITDGHFKMVIPKPDTHPYFDLSDQEIDKIGSDYTDKFGTKQSWHEPPSSFEQIGDQYKWRICTSCKNYEQNIQKFLAWVSKFIDAADGTEIGTYTSEEATNDATVVMHNGEADIKYPPVEYDNGWY